SPAPSSASCSCCARRACSAPSSTSVSELYFILHLLTDPVAFYQTHTLLIAEIGINSILAASMFVVLYSGQLSLAAPGFMAIGAYTSVLMGNYWNTPLPLNLVAGTLFAGVVGLAVGLPVLRLRGVFLAIATIGFIEALS